MNNETIFNNQQSILTESKKKFYSLKMIESLPVLEFGIEYSIINEKATVIIYDFETEDKFSVHGCLGLISSFIYNDLLKYDINSSSDLLFFLRIIHDEDPGIIETAFIDNRIHRSKNTNDISYWEFSDPAYTWLGTDPESLKRSPDNEVIETIKQTQSDFNTKPAYKYTEGYTQDKKEWEREELMQNMTDLQGKK